MKKGWRQVEMGQLCSIASGESDTIDAVENGPYAFFDRSKTVKRSSRFLYDCEALIVPGEGKEFLPRHYKGKFDLHQRAYALFDFSPSIEPRFLFHYLHYFSHYLPSVAVGATVKSLRRRHFLHLPVAVTSLQEQQRIVGVLDEAIAGLAAAQANAAQNLQNARALFESHRQSVFSRRGEGWVEKTLEDLCVVDWGNTDLTKSSYVEGGKFLAVSAAGCDGRIGHKEHDKFTPVLSAIGAQCGRMFLPEEDFTAIKNTITMTPRKGVCTGRFLYRLLTSVQLPKRGAAQPFIAKGDINAFRVVVPSSESEQARIAQDLEALEAETQGLTRLYEEKQAALEALKKSLLHQAFAGGL